MIKYLDQVIKTQSIDKPLFDEKFLKAILDYAPMVVVVINKNYEIMYVNDVVEKLVGYTEEALIGKVCYDVVNKGTMCDRCATREVIQTGKPSHLIKKEYANDGSVRYNERTVTPILKEDGSFDLMVEIMIDRTEEYKLTKRLENDFFKFIKTISKALEAKDRYTANHSENVKRYAILLGKDLNLSETEIQELTVAATLHDIGKIGVPDSIINKNGKLTHEEFEIIKQHSTLGSELLSEIESFGNIKEVVKYHHERIDGKGYPEGLKGEQLPLLSRIISIADSFDAMTSTRAYRIATDIEFAKNELLKCKGSQFDSELVDRFVALIDKGELVID